MKTKSAFFIALRYLWARAHEGGRYLRGAATGIAVSFIPIIVTLIMADGMIRGITDRYLELGTGHLQVFNSNDAWDEQSVIDLINEVDGIKGIWPEMRSMGVIAGKGGRTGVTVRATEPSFWADAGGERFLKIIEGEQKPDTDRDIVLGETLAANIGVKVGDTVRLMTIRTTESGRMMPRSASFTVRGIISCGYNELDALWCIISYEGGKRVLSSDQSSSSLLVKIDNPYKDADDKLWDVFLKIGSSYSIYTWKELLRSQYSSYESTRQLLIFIMTLIVIVAAVNVSSATSMLVLERKRDIAVLKVSGANVWGITKIFLFGSFLTGLFGSVIGIALGLFIGVNINHILSFLEIILSFFSGLFKGSADVKILDPGFYLETVPIVIDWVSIFLIGLFAIFCSVLSSWIPARRAGKLKPMELLRKT